MGSYYGDIREEELKNKVAADWFAKYDATQVLGNIDFSVAVKSRKKKESDNTNYLLWAESKLGTKEDINESFVQLILTIGKARLHQNEDYTPPPFLGAFDAEKIAFLPYHKVMEVFTWSDINWNVTPSNHKSEEFQKVLEMVRDILDKNKTTYFYDTHRKELKDFIKNNFRKGYDEGEGMQIDKNNFINIYLKWVKEVKPSIGIDWKKVKTRALIDGDFYLADLLSRDNKGIMENLDVLLKTDHYEFENEVYDLFSNVPFNDGQKAHKQFWRRYKRPPKEECWDYIVTRRDMLVPQDIRERKGAYFTPRRWVELSQEYIARELGEDWQEEYYVWDCCAGTGNLLAGLTNPRNVYASTLDKQDVQVMKELIEKKSLNLLEGQVFQFDFLNDKFEEKLPKGLQEIIADPEKRRRLVIFINPPYAETATDRTAIKGRQNKRGVSFTNTQIKYANAIGIATKELFVQFLIRIYDEINGAILANFSKLKAVQGPNFYKFRQVFKATQKQGFVCPAYTFDNVKGSFPIAFLIWDTGEKKDIDIVKTDVYDDKAQLIGARTFSAYSEGNFITDWYRKYHTRKESSENLGAIGLYGSDFQHNKFIRITNVVGHPNRWTYIVESNIIPTCVYLAVRHCIEASWLNDRDQFLWPKDTWLEDKEFQTDCLAYTLLHGQNRISSAGGTNHWIPFTEVEVGAKVAFESTFMSDFIRGKHKRKGFVQGDLFATATAEQQEDTQNFLIAAEPKEQYKKKQETAAITFSAEAQAVMDAGRELWRYYHSQPDPINDASFYDIRLHFQGVNAKGKMNKKSKDAQYTELLTALGSAMHALERKLASKVYEHGFLLY